MERILYVVSGAMVRGGTETMIMNYYRNFNKNNLQIDFVCFGSQIGAYEQEIESLGGKIYKLPSKRENLWKNLTGMYKICKEGNYKVIHVHMDAMSFYPLLMAKFANVKVRICHCHSTNHLYKNSLHFFFKEILKVCMPFSATDYFACSKAAGDWLYGKRSYQIIHNAVDLSKFRFNPKISEKIRSEFGFGKVKILGHVGNFNYPKNQDFLIRLFEDYHKKNPDTILVLVGDGPDRKKLENLVESLNIRKYVRFLGQRDNVCEIIQCFDVFLLTSFFEGLPVVIVEAQAAGIPCVLSDSISKECQVTSFVSFCSLKESVDVWGEKIDHLAGMEKTCQDQCITDAGYDIKTESRKLEKKYFEMMRR